MKYTDYNLEESENMLCDSTGLCNGYNCPNYIKCKGDKMRTRFDNSSKWIKSDGTFKEIEEMETTHLLAVLNMFVKKPQATISMLLTDIESGDEAWSKVINPNSRSKSLRNITSMSFSEVVDYSLNSPLGTSMIIELESRGVNVTNFLSEIMKEEEKCKTEWAGYSSECPECGSKDIRQIPEEEKREELIQHMMKRWSWSRERAEKRYDKLRG